MVRLLLSISPKSLINGLSRIPQKIMDFQNLEKLENQSKIQQHSPNDSAYRGLYTKESNPPESYNNLWTLRYATLNVSPQCIPKFSIGRMIKLTCLYGAQQNSSQWYRPVSHAISTRRGRLDYQSKPRRRISPEMKIPHLQF